MVSVAHFHGDVNNVDFTSDFKICWSDPDIEDDCYASVCIGETK